MIILVGNASNLLYLYQGLTSSSNALRHIGIDQFGEKLCKDKEYLSLTSH